MLDDKRQQHTCYNVSVLFFLPTKEAPPPSKTKATLPFPFESTCLEHRSQNWNTRAVPVHLDLWLHSAKQTERSNVSWLGEVTCKATADSGSIERRPSWHPHETAWDPWSAGLSFKKLKLRKPETWRGNWRQYEGKPVETNARMNCSSTPIYNRARHEKGGSIPINREGLTFYCPFMKIKIADLGFSVRCSRGAKQSVKYPISSICDGPQTIIAHPFLFVWGPGGHIVI